MTPTLYTPAGDGAAALDTPRLTLRRPTLADYEDSAAMWADPQVTRYTTGKPSTREEAWARLMRYIGHWAALGYGFWTVREAATGRFVGEAGFADFHRDIDPPLGDAPEIGWSLAPHAQGQGYATEAVRAAVAWGEGHFGPVRTVCMIDPANAASLGVARKCSYRPFAETTYRGDPTIILER